MCIDGMISLIDMLHVTDIFPKFLRQDSNQESEVCYIAYNSWTEMSFCDEIGFTEKGSHLVVAGKNGAIFIDMGDLSTQFMSLPQPIDTILQIKPNNDTEHGIDIICLNQN